MPLVQGGLGRIQTIWAGPTDTTVIPQNSAVADPDGGNGASFLSLLGGLLSEV